MTVFKGSNGESLFLKGTIRTYTYTFKITVNNKSLFLKGTIRTYSLKNGEEVICGLYSLKVQSGLFALKKEDVVIFSLYSLKVQSGQEFLAILSPFFSVFNLSHLNYNTFSYLFQYFSVLSVGNPSSFISFLGKINTREVGVTDKIGVFLCFFVKKIIKN